MIDHCLNCELEACREEHPDCGYQNAKDVRTVPVDMSLIKPAVPIAIQRRQEKLRRSWTMSKRKSQGFYGNRTAIIASVKESRGTQ